MNGRHSGCREVIVICIRLIEFFKLGPKETKEGWISQVRIFWFRCVFGGKILSLKFLVYWRVLGFGTLQTWQSATVASWSDLCWQTKTCPFFAGETQSWCKAQRQPMCITLVQVVVSNVYFHPYLGNYIFQMGWNHQTSCYGNFSGVYKSRVMRGFVHISIRTIFEWMEHGMWSIRISEKWSEKLTKSTIFLRFHPPPTPPP